MNATWPQSIILRAASLLAPANQRALWLNEWRTELWYIPNRGSTLFCLGAFRDALWLRRDHLRIEKGLGTHLESPLRCLVLLAILAVVSLLVAVSLPVRQNVPLFWRLRARDLPAGWLGMLPVFGLFMLATRFVLGGADVTCSARLWPERIRRGIFLALKIAIAQSIVMGVVLALVRLGALPVAPLAMCLLWILLSRWVLIDQRRRCPVCLRRLSRSVRIGTLSETFLDWYGAESICSRGHGLLHTSEMASSYSRKPRWLGLDDSWSGLFAKGVGRRT